MRIKFKFNFAPFRSYYEFEGVRERIRCNGNFYWNFREQTYRTCASNFPKIYCYDIYHGDMEIASRPTTSAGTWWGEAPFLWHIVDIGGRSWQIVETWNVNIWSVDWKTTDGKWIMAFRRKQCCGGTAVIRSDWSENVGLLVGMVIPLVLSTG